MRPIMLPAKTPVYQPPRDWLVSETPTPQPTMFTPCKPVLHRWLYDQSMYRLASVRKLKQMPW